MSTSAWNMTTGKSIVHQEAYLGRLVGIDYSDKVLVVDDFDTLMR